MSATAAIEGVELDDFIKAQARLERAPSDVEGVVRALSLPDVDTWKRVEQGWRARIGEDEHLAHVVEIFLADYVAELRGPSADGAEAADGEADAPSHPVRQEMASYMQAPAASALASAPRPLAMLAPFAPPVPAPVAPLVAHAPPAWPVPAPSLAQPHLAQPPLVPPGLVAAPPASVPASSRLSTTAPVLGPVSSTAPGDAQAAPGSAPPSSTPFAGRTTPERLQRLRAEGAPSQEAPLPRPASKPSLATATMMVSSPDDAPVGSQTLPFNDGRKKAAYPELTVDRYAAFAAEVHAKGASRALLERYGIGTSQAMVALHMEQERRFAADPALRARFEERKAHFLRFMQPTR